MANYRAKAKWASLAVEAQKISERTRAGMARAKAQGKRIGRLTLSLKLKQQTPNESRQVLFWALDRLTREGMVPTIMIRKGPMPMTAPAQRWELTNT
jgi:hypothetical protein